MVVLLSGCTPDMAMKFTRGIVVPNATIELVFSPPLSTQELLPIYEKVAHLAGYRCGSENVEEFLKTHNDRHSFFDWYLTQSRPHQHYKIAFTLPSSDAKSNKVVYFIFQNESIEDFTEEDWIKIVKWKNEYLPQAFPQAEIRMIVHPAEFTNPEYAAQLEQKTGLIIPEKLRQRYGIPRYPST